MSWLPGATVGPEADTGNCSDAGSSPHHDCSETTTQNAHWGMRWNHIGMIPSFVGPATLSHSVLNLSWILLLILFWCIVFGSLELCWSTRLFQGLCAAVKSLDKLWCFPVVNWFCPVRKYENVMLSMSLKGVKFYHGGKRKLIQLTCDTQDITRSLCNRDVSIRMDRPPCGWHATLIPFLCRQFGSSVTDGTKWTMSGTTACMPVLCFTFCLISWRWWQVECLFQLS